MLYQINLFYEICDFCLGELIPDRITRNLFSNDFLHSHLIQFHKSFLV